MMDCIFCGIVHGEAEAVTVYEDEVVLAFVDIQPINQGHLLVIPKQHRELTTEVNDAVLSRMFLVAKRLNLALRRPGLRCEGINYFLADGAAAGQEVAHAHLHIFPRWAGDGFGLRFSAEYGRHPPREELAEVAELIRRHV